MHYKIFSSRLFYQKPDLNPYLLAGPRSWLLANAVRPLSWKSTPQLVAYSTDYALGEEKDFCLSFRFLYRSRGGNRRLFELPGVFLLETAPSSGHALRVRMLGTDKSYVIAAGTVPVGWCLVELARKNKQLCVFVNGRPYGLPNESFPAASGGWKPGTPDKRELKDGVFYGEAKTDGGSVFPARTENKSNEGAFYAGNQKI